MTYEERLQNVSVLGAAGKMGSGILLLTAVEMADLSLLPENKGKSFVLNAIDVSPEGLSGLMNYLRDQIRKVAEKKQYGCGVCMPTVMTLLKITTLLMNIFLM